MTDKTLSIKLTAQDGISKVLKAVARTGETVGDALQKSGTQAAKGIDKISDSADRAKGSIDGFDVALTAIGGAAAYAGNAAMNQERQLVALDRAYGDASDTMADFADQMQRTTQYSDEAARESARIFSSLAREYGLSLDQIQQLMMTSADLASLAGVGLEEASQAVQSAIRGETEHAESLGLAMNQTAIDAEGLTLAMGNAEAAQFRFNALMDQSAYAQGAANEMLQTSAGEFQQLKNQIQDVAASTGEFIGPLGSMVGGLGMAVGGVGNLTGAFGKLGTATKWLVSSPAGLAITGLVAGIGTLGMALRDSGDDAESAEEAYQSLQDSVLALDDAISQARLSGDFALARELEAMNLTVESGLSTVTDTYSSWFGDFNKIFEDNEGNWQGQLSQFLDTNVGQEAIAWAQENRDIPQEVFDEILSGSEEAIGRNAGTIRTIIEDFYDQFAPDDADKARINDEVADIFDLMGNELVDQERLLSQFNAIWADFGQTGDVEGLIADLDALEQQTISTLDAMNAMVEADYLRFRGDVGLGDQIEQLGQLQSRMQDINAVLTQGEQQAYAEGWETINEAIRNSEVDADRVIGRLRNLEYQLASGQITEEQYARSVVELSLNLDDYAISADDAAEATERLTQSAGRAVGEMAALALVTKGAADQTDALNRMLEMEQASWVEKGQKVDEARDSLTAYRAEIDQLNQDFAAGFLEVTGDSDFLSQWNMTGMASEASLLAESINDVSASMDGLQRVIIGNTDALGSQMQGLEDWALGLVGVQGEVGEVDKLLAEGRITWDQYTDAQAAQVEISEANATVQRDLLAIQAMQAPVLADNADALAEYVEQLRLMNDGTEEGAQQQLAALAMMDGAVMGQVQQFTEMIGMMGRIGPEGAESMQMFIDSVVATNPALTAVLVEMGLIEEAANGQYVLNLDAAGAISEIDALNQTVADLIDMLDDGKLNDSYTANIDLDVEGREDVEGAKQDINDLMALSAQERMITIATNLQVPSASQLSELGTALANSPVEVPVTLVSPSLGAGGALGGAASGLLSGLEVTATVRADVTEWEDAKATAAADDGTTLATAVVMVDGDNSVALQAINQTRSELSNVDGASASIVVTGENANALAAIGDIQAYDGLTLATSYYNIVTRYSSQGTPTARHGGIPGYALGGLVQAELAEAEHERLHFATGGTAEVFDRGIYNVPTATYVSPNNAVNTSYGGDTYFITVQGGDSEQIKRVFADEIIPAMTASVQRAKAGQGVRV